MAGGYNPSLATATVGSRKRIPRYNTSGTKQNIKIDAWDQKKSLRPSLGGGVLYWGD